MDFKKYLEKSVSWYNALNPRYKVLINFLIIAVLINLFLTHIYSRQARARRSLKREFSSLDNRLTELRSQFPDLDIERKEIEKHKHQLDVLSNTLSRLEQAFPTQARVPQLLAKLIESAKDKVDFVSIVPKASKKVKGLYGHLDIEMIVRSSYADLSNYVFRLEKLPELVVISDLNLEKRIDASTEFIESKIILSTLLTKEEKIEKPRKPIPSRDLPEPLIKKDPFIAKEEMGAEADALAALKLTGIIFRNEKSCVIINGSIYKIGDKIGDKTIKQIFKDEVIVTDEEGAYKLKLAK